MADGISKYIYIFIFMIYIFIFIYNYIYMMSFFSQDPTT